MVVLSIKSYFQHLSYLVGHLSKTTQELFYLHENNYYEKIAIKPRFDLMLATNCTQDSSIVCFTYLFMILEFYYAQHIFILYITIYVNWKGVSQWIMNHRMLLFVVYVEIFANTTFFTLHILRTFI